MWIVDQFTLLFLTVAPALVASIIFLIVIWKMGPQARRLGKANLTKKRTNLVASEGGTLDIDIVKQVRSGHVEASKTEAYELVQTKDNPELSRPFTWKGTGIPVTVSAGRKSVAVSPNTLTAIAIAENGEAKTPSKLRTWAKSIKIKVPKTVEKVGEEIKAKGKTIEKTLLEIEPLKLLWYFSGALDTDAQDVLLDKKYQQGFQDAGKQWMKLGLGLGVSLSVGLIALVLILVASGGVGA